jgi:hypothetical protein
LIEKRTLNPTNFKFCFFSHKLKGEGQNLKLGNIGFYLGYLEEMKRYQKISKETYF